MKRKNRNSEVEEVIDTIGGDNETEETSVKEKKNPFAWLKSRVFKKTMAIIGVVLLALVLAGAIINFMGYGKILWHNMKFWRLNDINYRLSYTVDNTKAEKKKDIVVATYGNQKLTNGELQAHYWSAVYEYVNYIYSGYTGDTTLDITKPLSEQYYGDTGKTYEQWFLELALTTWKNYAVIVQMAEDAGFQLSAEEQAELATFETEFQSVMTEYQYTDAEKFIDEQFFPGCSYEQYLKYNKMNYTAAIYYNYLYTSINPSQEDLEAYYTAHEAEFVENQVDKSAGKYYDVRHILVGIQGGTNDKDEYGDDQWAICLEQAQKLLDDFLANEPSNEKFAELAFQNSVDPGSAENGGLYTELTKDTPFIDDFKNWYLDEARQPGDTGLVKNAESSTQGYHIMYFVGSVPIWEREAEVAILGENADKKIAEAEEKYTLDVNYKKIVISTVSLTG